MKKLKLWMSLGCGVLLLQGRASAVSIQMDPQTSLNQKVTAAEFTTFFTNAKGLCVFVLGLCTITALISFILSILKLNTSVDNDFIRSRAIKGLLFSGLALALFGGATLLVSVFWNLLTT